MNDSSKSSGRPQRSVNNPITLFTKPWSVSIEELGERLVNFGVDGLELPVRDGYPVNPDNIAEELPRAAEALRRLGLKIYSVATLPDERSVSACGGAGVPIIRVCEHIDMKIGYQRSVDAIKRRYQALLPALESAGVTIGLQNHANYDVGSAVGLMQVIGEFDPTRVGAVLDVAHCGLDGEPEDMAIDIAWSHLCMVNLKNAFRFRTNGPEAEEAAWRIYWTTGRHGYVSWRKTLSTLSLRGYAGPICLCAEYSNPAGKGDLKGDDVNRLVNEDLAFVRELMGGIETAEAALA